MTISRLFIALVILSNLQAAVVFLWKPAAYTAGFELEGFPGQVALRGMAILFLMWNIPYLVAFSHPVRHRIALLEAIAMQTIGLVGESILLQTIPAGYAVLRTSIWRFILFDGTGLIFLISTLAITWRYGRVKLPENP